MHYEEGLRLLDQALAIDIPKDDNNDEVLKAKKNRIKMSRTRQQVVFRIHELRSKLHEEPSPPKYDEIQLQDALNDDTLCMTYVENPLIGKLFDSFVRKKPLVKYQSQSEVIKVTL